MTNLTKCLIYNGRSFTRGWSLPYIKNTNTPPNSKVIDLKNIYYSTSNIWNNFSCRILFSCYLHIYVGEKNENYQKNQNSY